MQASRQSSGLANAFKSYHYKPSAYLEFLPECFAWCLIGRFLTSQSGWFKSPADVFQQSQDESELGCWFSTPYAG